MDPSEYLENHDKRMHVVWNSCKFCMLVMNEIQGVNASRWNEIFD